MPSGEPRRALPTMESVKHVLKLMSVLPPPLLPRIFPHPPKTKVNGIQSSYISNNQPPPSASEKPPESGKEIIVTPSAQKRKRQDEEPLALPAVIRSEKEDSPPMKKLRTNGAGFDVSPIPAARIAGVTLASPSVPPLTPDASGKHTGDAGFDAPKRRPKAQLVNMRNALVKHIRQNKKSADHLWEDGVFLETAIPADSPQNDPHLSSVIQKTDSLLFGLVALWCEDEHMSVENEIWRSYSEPFTEYAEWKRARETEPYLPCARWLGAVRWTRYVQRVQEVLRSWEPYTSSASPTKSAAASILPSAIALTHWILAIAHLWCAEAHVRHSAMASRTAYKDEKLGELRPGEYDYLQDRTSRALLPMPTSVPRSVVAARYHSDRVTSYLDRARSVLLAPGFLASEFPKTWENCTRLPESSKPPLPQSQPQPAAFDPWSPDPLSTYRVPSQAAADAFSFQWPLDLRCPATHFAAFGRSLLYEFGGRCWPMCELGNRPFGLGVCFTRPKGEKDSGLPVHSLWRA
ncbi:hypothetical protein DACRYDRAFT_105034 [Dacryopinax primogenitus]|uniref:Uncharacterized protein n=1 Tax=Dacryopinax primogenitus (strain DJM 731) TaxID=1858805 RepID=M5G141_DACPD|nr:uncharacterized protein DACRYDRAFT_105034 [Dacryopinax primogenitus]EJU03961.1 hypothetical protein DACRYDRAFT_105034 [Dacryopinax primogenitus]